MTDILGNMLTEYGEANGEGKWDMFDEAASRMIEAEKQLAQLRADLAAAQAQAEELRAIEEAAREFVNNTPVSEIELARDSIGNTNATAILRSRERLVAALDRKARAALDS